MPRVFKLRGRGGHGAPTIPGQFATNGWSVSDAGSGDDVYVTLITLPANNGSAISGVQYQIDGGSWVSLSAAALGDYTVTGLVEDDQVDFALRAINAAGTGPASDTKAVTPTESIDPEFVTGQEYPLAWQENFQSLSMRTGTHAPASQKLGKGTWSDVGLWYRNSGYVKGFGGFGYDLFIDHSYNWQGDSPGFPALGMLDITADGLIVRGTGLNPLARTHAGNRYPASSGSNISSALGSFYNNAGATSTGNPRVVTTHGQVDARIEDYRASTIQAGLTYRYRVTFTYGTSNKIYVFVDNASQGRSTVTGTGTVATIGTGLSGTPFDEALYVSGANHVLEFSITAPVAGGLNWGVGPNSTVDGQTISIVSPQVISPAYAAKPYFLAGCLSTLYSTGIRAPFYRETTVIMPDGAHAFPAVWGLDNKTETEPNAKYWETDDLEIFGDSYANNIASFGIHLSTTTGPSFVTYHAGGPPKTAPVNIPGNEVRVGVWVTTTQVRGFINGIELSGAVNLPAGTDTAALHHTILNTSFGLGYLGIGGYPDGDTSTYDMLVKSVKYYAPLSNTSGSFPPEPPVPGITWGGSFAGGSIPSNTASGTTVAVVTSAATCRILGTPKLVGDYNAATKIGVTTAIKTFGRLTAGSLPFYIEGFDALSNGVPGIVPQITATVTDSGGVAPWYDDNAYIDLDYENDRYFVNGTEYDTVAAMVTAGVYVNGAVAYVPNINTFLFTGRPYYLYFDGTTSASSPAVGVSQTAVSLDNNTVNELVQLHRQPTTLLGRLSVNVGGVAIVTLDQAAVANSTAVKYCAQVNHRHANVSQNGVFTSSSAYTGATPAVTKLVIKDISLGIRPWGGTVKRIQLLSSLGSYSMLTKTT